MSYWFQAHYAPRYLRRHGTADHWSPYQQTVLVRRVVAGINRRGQKVGSGAGWLQWPTTRIICGV